MKSQLKVGLLLIGSHVLFLLLFSFILYYFLYNYSYSDFYKRLATRANITASYRFEPDSSSSNSVKQLRDQYLEHLSNEKEYIIKVENAAVALSQANAQNLPVSLIQGLLSNGKSEAQINNTFYAGTRYRANEKDYLVIISAENYYATHHLSFLRTALVIGVALAVVVTVFFSFYFSRQIFEPIRLITEQVTAISTDNIHLRLDEGASDPEIKNLTGTFNNLLNRVETALETQKNFISNASHEFSTPLTSIIGEAELALKKERTQERYQDALRTILQEAERLNDVSQALILLAQTGYKENRLTFEVTRVDELIWQIKELMNKLVPSNQIKIDFELMPENPLKLKVMANKQLLTLAITNLLSNACKYSQNAIVTISISATENHVLLVINDKGIGIPASELQYIYDPFFRASNTKNFDGYGIGLPLTRNIILIHKGKLKVNSVQNQGTTVKIELPFAFQ